MLTKELKNASNHEMDEDMQNDLNHVYAEKESLTLRLGPWPHLIDSENCRIVED